MTALPPAVVQEGPDVLLAIHVQPRAARNQLVRRPPERLTLRLTAPPVEGAANLACRNFLADLLGLPKFRVTILRGETARRKLVRIADADAPSVLARLEAVARAH